MTQTGVVVVTFNSAEVIERCLDACAHLSTIVVDNASNDGTAALIRKHPDVKLIANSSNNGFAGAVNQGVTALETELVLLLNPDVELLSNVDGLAEACSSEGVGLATGLLLDQSGKAQAGFTLRRFPTAKSLIFEVLGINRLVPGNPVNRRYRCLDMDLTEPSDVEQPPGAFLMFRREVWQRLGGFDTQFAPLWFEDVDFAKRASDLGVRIRYIPSASARHLGGHSIAKMDWGCRELCWYASLLRYASKHLRPHAHRGVSAAVMLGSLFRAVVVTFSRRSLRPLKVYAKVARMAGQTLIHGRVVELRCLVSKSIG